MSRASSGFESSHLPPSPPELHSLTSAGNSVEKPHPACSSVSGRAISRSQSCPELRDRAAPQSWRRSFSLNLLCKGQKREKIHLDNQSASSPFTERSTQDSGNVHQVGSAPATQHSTLQQPVRDGDAAQCAPYQSSASGERSELSPVTVPILNPHTDAFSTQASSVHLTSRVVSANIEARRLKMKRDKKNPVKVCSLKEEKL